MPTTCFASYEIHPTTKGGCGVLLHNAAAHLLKRGHDVIFLLSMPAREFEQFRDRDRKLLPHADRCRAYHVDDLCDDFPYDAEQIPTTASSRACVSRTPSTGSCSARPSTTSSSSISAAPGSTA